MKRAGVLVVGLIALAAAGWTAGWFWMRGSLVAVLDAEEAQLAAGGVELAYATRQIGGFPLSYTVRYGDLRLSEPQGGTTLAAPVVTGAATVFDPRTVAMTLPPEMTLTVAPPDMAPVPFRVLSQNLVVRTGPGGDGTGALDASADRLSLVQEGSALFSRFDATFAPFALSLRGGAAGAEVGGTLTAPETTVSYAVSMPDLGEASSQTRVTGLSVAFDADRPVGETAEAVAREYLSGARDARMRWTAASASSETVTPTPGGPVRVAATAAAQATDVAIENAVVTIGGEADAIRYDLDLASFGMGSGTVPVTLARAEGRFSMPLARREAPEPFAYRVAFRDLAMGEPLWAMIDPASVLPRDPGSVEVALTGLARWTVDPTDTDAMAALTDSPFDIRSVKLDALRLALVGATVDATGEGSMAPDQQVPMGRVSVRATGLSQLIGRLATMGIVPPDQIALAQTMLATYARPGETPDSHVSEVEMGEAGLTVNGLPLQ